jgi:predicted enzyme related to lactoylglutathione lyase
MTVGVKYRRYDALMTTGIDAHYYLAKDLGRAKVFYREALGLEPAMDFGGGVEYALPDDTAFGLAAMPNGEWHPAGGVMFAVPDIEAALARVRAAGGEALSSVMDHPTCLTVWCNDTEGNNFALHHLKTQT